jgi:uncharacterized protein YceH (UPF0502 family)
MMKLTPVETRVVAALVEKDRTTPDSYPLTTNSLVAACNQKTSRDPVMTVTATEVDAALLELRQRKMVRTIRGTGERTFKHRHTLDEALGLDDRELACIAVLALRGPQTPGELRTRSERYVEFEDLADVEAALTRLADRDEPLVRNTGRGPGQSQDRWIQLLSEDPAGTTVGGDQTGTSTTGAGHGLEVEGPAVGREQPRSSPVDSGGLAAEVAALRVEVDALTALVEEIRAELGMSAD